MKLKHWMESFSRARKKSKSDRPPNNTTASLHSATDLTPSSSLITKEKSRSRKLSVKDIMMPNNIPRERKHVRDNYPAVAAYLDHRSPLSNIQNFNTFRPLPNIPPSPRQFYHPFAEPPKTYQRLQNDPIYDVPMRNGTRESQNCACYRHQPTYVNEPENSSSSYYDDSASNSGTLNSRRVNIRTNPWIRPQTVPTSSSETSSFTSSRQREKPVAPPKPQRKRPPLIPFPATSSSSQEDDMDDIVCSDKSVGTDGDEYLLESEHCDCDDCACSSSSCHSFSSLKLSSSLTGGLSFSSETIQPSGEEDSDAASSITSTPTILNDFDGDAEEEDTTLCSDENGRDSAMDSPGSGLRHCRNIAASVHSNGRNIYSNTRNHFSPADSHTSWKYFDDDDEVDSGHGQTASSLGSPGSAEDYNAGQNNSNKTKYSNNGKRQLEGDYGDLDTNIEMIRTRLQKQVYQLKHEQTALDRKMERSRGYYDAENVIEEDFIIQKKAILAETLNLLKRQLDEQNDRLQMSYSALQNLHKHQVKWYEPRNRDGRALSTLYNDNLRETFC